MWITRTPVVTVFGKQRPLDSLTSTEIVWFYGVGDFNSSPLFRDLDLDADFNTVDILRHALLFHNSQKYKHRFYNQKK